MSDTTLSDIAKQLQQIADDLTKLSQNIVDTHNQLGDQLKQSSTDSQQKPLDQTGTSKQGG